MLFRLYRFIGPFHRHHQPLKQTQFAIAISYSILGSVKAVKLHMELKHTKLLTQLAPIINPKPKSQQILMDTNS